MNVYGKIKKNPTVLFLYESTYLHFNIGLSYPLAYRELAGYGL